MARVGDRYPLLLYKRMMDRYRPPSFLLAFLLLGLWYPASRAMLPWPRPPADAWLLSGGLVSLAFWVFARIGPRWAYVQPREDHLRVQTPIYRLKVSYRRIENTRPIDFARMFPPSTLRRKDRRLLEPFFSATAVGVDVYAWPIRPGILRLFLNPFFLATDRPGLVLLVEEWMGLSNQLSSKIDTWRGSQRKPRKGPGIGAADILRED
jgi:hypothetical protein